MAMGEITNARYMGRGYVTIPREVMFNPALSCKAKCVLIYLLDKAGLPHWVVRREHIAEVLGINRSTVGFAVAELTSAGFLHIHQERCKGKIVGSTWHYSDTPDFLEVNPNESLVLEKPSAVKPPAVKPPAVDQALVNMSISKPQEIKPQERDLDLEKEKKQAKKELGDSASPRAASSDLANERISFSQEDIQRTKPAPLHSLREEEPSGETNQVSTIAPLKASKASKNTPRSEAPPLEIPEHLRTLEFLDAWADKCQHNEETPKAKRSALRSWLKELAPFTAQEATHLVRSAMVWQGLNLASQLTNLQKLRRETMWTGQAASKNMTVPQLLEKHEAVSSDRVAFYKRHIAHMGQRNGSEFHLGMKSESEILVQALEKQAYDAEYKASYPARFAEYQSLAAPSQSFLFATEQRRIAERAQLAALPESPAVEDSSRKALLAMARQDIEEYGYTELLISATERSTILADISESINF
jgi:hypothetical protein